MKNRAGCFVQQSSGYRSFKPIQLPPDPPVIYDNEMIMLLSKANRFLGKLDGVTQTLPDPELFVAMYVQKEAVLSSQIEGTQASLTDVLGDVSEKREDISDVVQYVSAMKYGLNRLNDFPLSLRLIREIHAILLKRGRGSSRNPGEFRKTQNWIGPTGCSLQSATFVPPSVPDMKIALDNLERFFYDNTEIPPLIKIAIIHAQFESIHPFLDGNGRMGRLLITFWLCQQKILSQPLLYLSYFFKKHRSEYYDLLMNVRRNGDWESWEKFFLTGIAETSEEATETAKEILLLRTRCERKLAPLGSNHTRVLDFLFGTPIITKSEVAKTLEVTPVTSGRIIDELCNMSILVDITPEKRRYKRYAFAEYISILNRGTEI